MQINTMSGFPLGVDNLFSLHGKIVGLITKEKMARELNILICPEMSYYDANYLHY